MVSPLAAVRSYLLHRPHRFSGPLCLGREYDQQPIYNGSFFGAGQLVHLFDQTDLQKTNEKNGLHDFLRILEEMEEFSCTEFTIGDIVRSGFVRSYLINKIKLGIGIE